MTPPRILIPEPTAFDSEYNERGWPQYAEAIREAGGEPVLVPLHASQEEQAHLIAGAHGVLLPGSPADVNPEKWGELPHSQTASPDPLREAADELLLQDAFNLQKPVFGICYGLQSMNVWRGGSLVQHLETAVNHSPGRDVADAHPLRVRSNSKLATLVKASGTPDGTVVVNSSHHQALERLGDQLLPVATSPVDGVIEAVEDPAARFVVGVQWHPERTTGTSALSQQLFRSFVEAAEVWRPRANGPADPAL